jgi:hypothetical protein
LFIISIPLIIFFIIKLYDEKEKVSAEKEKVQKEKDEAEKAFAEEKKRLQDETTKELKELQRKYGVDTASEAFGAGSKVGDGSKVGADGVNSEAGTATNTVLQDSKGGVSMPPE